MFGFILKGDTVARNGTEAFLSVFDERFLFGKIEELPLQTWFKSIFNLGSQIL